MNQNNKTGHFTCYKNRTFSFATDITQEEIAKKGTKKFGGHFSSPGRGRRLLYFFPALCMFK